MNPLICVVGSTATGKTKFAVALASQINGEILSADSRQIYRGMDLGTGKDLMDFDYNQKHINYHLIDIADAGEEYNVFQYKKDFQEAYNKVILSNKVPILVGGSGMYVDAIVSDYQLDAVPENPILREKLADFSMEELIAHLKSIRRLHNTTDIRIRKRCIRAIEIEEYYQKNEDVEPVKSKYNSLIFGIKFDRNIIRQRITKRLSDRIKNGMIEEVRNLIDSGVSPDKLKYYGLEYKFLTSYILGEMSEDMMFEKLNIAIHQFAKRQDTWWRRMEKNGTKIHWIDGSLPLDQKLNIVMNKIASSSIIG